MRKPYMYMLILMSYLTGSILILMGTGKLCYRKSRNRYLGNKIYSIN